MRLHARLLRHPWLYRRLTSLAIALLALLARGRGALRRVPLAGGWSSERDFPAPQGRSFMGRYHGPDRKPE
jgi:L-lactate dehydrogenase complex protein LldF